MVGKNIKMSKETLTYSSSIIKMLLLSIMEQQPLKLYCCLLEKHMVLSLHAHVYTII